LTPKTIGIVWISLLSSFKSLISNGIVIAKTNKNRSNKSGINLKERELLLSITTSSVVVRVQTIEIRNIFKKGISLNESFENNFNGYKNETINKGIRRYKLVWFRLKINTKLIRNEIRHIILLIL
jgi:hypothetical protein